METTLKLRICTIVLFAALLMSHLANVVEAGRPRGGGDVFMKYTGKVVTNTSAGAWTPWRRTSATLVCRNGLWSFDYTRWRSFTKTYWMADRWLAFKWLDNNIVFYEYWKNFVGPFTYTVWQKQMKEVYWFNPADYDPRIRLADINEVFYRDSLLWADWTGIDQIVDPDTHVPVQSHRVYFDEVLYYEQGTPLPGLLPPGTDAMVINLDNYPTGGHMIRIETMWANGTVTPDFLMVPLTTIDPIELEVEPPVIFSAFAGEMNVLHNALRVTNNLDEPRAVYFQTRDMRTQVWGESFFDIFVDVDIPGNGTVIPPMTDSFFDVWIEVAPHTPTGMTIETEIIAMTLEGLHSDSYPSASDGVPTRAQVQVEATVQAPRTSLSATPQKALAGRDTIVLEGTGFAPNSQVGLTASFFDVFFDVVLTNSSGGFTYSYPLPLNFKPYGEHAFAALGLTDGPMMRGLAATVALGINGPDNNGDGKVDMKDIGYVVKYFGQITTGSPLAAMSFSTAIIGVPLSLVWLRRKRKQQQ